MTYGEYLIKARVSLGAEPRPADLATDAQVNKAAHLAAKLLAGLDRDPERYGRMIEAARLGAS